MSLPDLTLGPLDVLALDRLANGRCLLCSRPARPDSYTCDLCHERVVRDAVQGAIRDALEPK